MRTETAQTLAQLAAIRKGSREILHGAVAAKRRHAEQLGKVQAEFARGRLTAQGKKEDELAVTAATRKAYRDLYVTGDRDRKDYTQAVAGNLAAARSYLSRDSFFRRARFAGELPYRDAAEQDLAAVDARRNELQQQETAWRSELRSRLQSLPTPGGWQRVLEEHASQPAAIHILDEMSAGKTWNGADDGGHLRAAISRAKSATVMPPEIVEGDALITLIADDLSAAGAIEQDLLEGNEVASARWKSIYIGRHGAEKFHQKFATPTKSEPTTTPVVTPPVTVAGGQT